MIVLYSISIILKCIINSNKLLSNLIIYSIGLVKYNLFIITNSIRQLFEILTSM